MKKIGMIMGLLCFAAGQAALVSGQSIEQLGDPKTFLRQAAALPALPSAAARPLPLAEAPIPQLPDKFEIVEKIFSLTHSFTLKKDGAKLGEITQRILAWTRTFDYRDAQGNQAAQAHAKLLSWGTDILVEDPQGRRIGEIKENVFKSLFKVHTEYSILDGQGKVAATSKKTDWITTTFDLYDNNGRLVATMRRPWLNFSDHWSVEIRDQKAIDGRVMVMIAAYKTAVDNDRRKEERR